MFSNWLVKKEKYGREPVLSMDTTTKKKKHVSGVTVVSYIVLALLSLSAILPFVLMFTSSISSEESITQNRYSHSFGVQSGCFMNICGATVQSSDGPI